MFNPNAVGRDSWVHLNLSNFLVVILQPKSSKKNLEFFRKFISQERHIKIFIYGYHNYKFSRTITEIVIYYVKIVIIFSIKWWIDKRCLQKA